MEKYYELQYLSKYRRSLMGLAMLLVMMFHTKVPNNLDVHLKNIKSIGDIGVDIFLFLSGIGLFYSYKKCNNILIFWKKRALRILPEYLIIFSVYYLITSYGNCKGNIIRGIFEFFFNIFTLNFWIRLDLVIWFVPSICLLYFISPFYFKWIESNKLIKCIGTCLIIIIIGITLANIKNFSKVDYLILIDRIPIFLIGCTFGQAAFEKKKVNKLIVLVSFGVMFIGIYAYIPLKGIAYSYKYLLYIIMTPSICIVFSYFFEFMKEYRFPVLSYLGKYSFEVYLLHERFLEVFSHTQLDFLWKNEFAIILTIVLCPILQCIANKVVECCSKNKGQSVENNIKEKSKR